MNICLVSQEFPPETARGGIGTQNWNKARALARLGHTVHVVSAAPAETQSVLMEQREGYTIHRIPSPGFEFDVHEQATFCLGYSWEVLRFLRRLLAQESIDLIDFAEYGAEGFAFLVDRTEWNSVPVVVQLHGPLAMFAEKIGWPEKDSNLFKVGVFMEDFVIKHADALMACSSNIADFTASYHGVPRESIDAVHCGVDIEAFFPRDQEQPPDHRPTILFVGNIAENKGLRVVFDSTLNLKAKFPDILLVILGKGDDDLQRRLMIEAEEKGASSNIHFAGFAGRDRIADHYRDADVFCSPAQHEVGVANVYIEAMACGCPVVACNTGGAPEAVEDGGQGILVPPFDVDATTAALDRILSNPSLHRELSRSARERAVSYFAMDKYIQRVMRTYERACNHTRNRVPQ